MGTETVQLTVFDISKFYSIWETSLFLGAKLLNYDNSSWRGPWYLVFNVEKGKGDEFEQGLLDSFGDAVSVNRSEAVPLISGAD